VQGNVAQRFGWLPRLSPDGWLLFATCAVRMFAYGFLSVVLGLYLASLGMDLAAIGAIFTVALVGGAVMTVFLTQTADRLGRKRVLIVGAGLMATAGAVFAITNQPQLLFVAAIIGTISPSGKEVGPFLSIEQAILPQTTSDEQRTHVFATYNIVGSLSGALGALAAGLPTLLGLTPMAGYQSLIWAYAAAGLLLLLLFSHLSRAVEAPPNPGAVSGSRWRFGIHRSRKMVVKLAALFALDSFSGGFVVQGLVAYWFSLRYQVDLATLGAIFFGTNVLAAVSFLAAVPIARRVGLLNTMVFTHLPSHVFLMSVPLMPSLELAVAMLFCRHLLSQLDVPTRQSYTMAIVDPDERAAVAGAISVTQTAAAALAPTFAGAMLVTPALGLPFLVAGGIKVFYDLALWAVFRGVRPPEEQAARPALAPSEGGTP
jgi:MFS family permease